MHRNDLDRRSRRNTRGTVSRWAWLAGLVATTWAAVAQAQVGSGGTVGTVAGGNLSTSDFFIGVQKMEGVNLSDVDKARFLNHASCQCKRDVWIKTILASATSAANAQLLPGTDTVTVDIGFACDNTLYRPSCLQLGSLSLSQFRLTGLTVRTTVDVLAKSYGATVTTVGTVTGSGGDTGSGGSTGSGGTTGTEATTATDPCAVGDAFSQTVYIFVERSPGMYDGSGQLAVVIDGTPPPAPSPVTVTAANEALIVDWTSVNNNNSVPDLQGYQIFCSRADQYQVFKDGTFSTSVDSCPNTDAVYPTTNPDAGTSPTAIFPTDLDPMALMNGNTHYLCSDFLSTSTTSHRVQILQNGIQYGVAVASVDTHGNASLAFPVPAYAAPVPTLDFYHQYRNADPQGGATGGCSVSGHATGSDTLSCLAALAVVLGALRKRRSGRSS
jgi:hypothetical protein